MLNELSELFKAIVSAKGNRGVINHRRFVSRIRAGNQLFNNDEHHDSHEFISWLIDEINMNVIEDYRYQIKKKLTSKDYNKEQLRLIQDKDESLKQMEFTDPPNYSAMTKE